MLTFLRLVALFGSVLPSITTSVKIDENFVTALAFLFVALFVEGILVAGSVSLFLF